MRIAIPVLRGLALAGCLLCTAAVIAAERSGGWRLAHESSPYLQLHAGNPVEWHPWGAPALEKARRENKPLFISIGYFTCHWCHVMEDESFSNDAIAKLLNEHFIAIKIDREQRPDLDDAYMEYVMLTTGRGGWPMSVWATPGGEPFLGGTYYPPESGPRGTGFRELLERIVALWQDDEAAIRSAAREAVQQLAGRDQQETAARIDDTPLEAARREYRETYDALQGGFGPAPKFPQPARLLFLLDDSDEESHAMALYTLERMIAGGIHDQLGGGFHRYAVDFEWHLPHFEKMLYDQALIARACLAAWRRTQRPEFAAAVRSTLDFALRDMRHTQGGFYSALGADSPAGSGEDAHLVEGAYYTWDWSQLVAALGEGALLDWAVARYGLLERGNALHDPLGEMDGRNVLHLVLDDRQLADRFDVDLLTVRQRNARVAGRLSAARAARPPLPVDDKVVTAWNGYMIATLALAGRLLDEPRYLEAAGRAAGFVLEHLYEDGVLYRDWRDGVRGVNGFNEDYAAVAEGLLALYRVTGERRWLMQARALVDRQLELFWDDTHGGFYNTAGGTAAWLRGKQLVDGASVADNAVSVHVLLALARLTGDQDYRRRARQTAGWAMARLDAAPSDMPYMLRAWPQLQASATDN